MATFKPGDRVRVVRVYCTPHLLGKETIVIAIDVRGIHVDWSEYIGTKIALKNIYGMDCIAPDGSIEPIIDSGRTVVEFEVGVSPWVPEHLREKREQPATLEPGLTK